MFIIIFTAKNLPCHGSSSKTKEHPHHEKHNLRLVSQVPIWQGERTQISTGYSDCPKELNQNGRSNLSRLKDKSVGDSVNIFNP